MSEFEGLKERLLAMYSHRGDGIPTQPVNPDGQEALAAIETLEARYAELMGLAEGMAGALETARDCQTDIAEGHAFYPNSPRAAGIEKMVAEDLKAGGRVLAAFRAFRGKQD